MIRIYGPLISRAFRAIWMCEEAAAPYEHHSIDFSQREHLSPDYLAINPAGKVPSMQDGDLTIFESCAIMNYIGEKYPETGLTPKSGTRDRAFYDQWMYFLTNEIDAPLWTMAKAKFALPEKYRVPEINKACIYELERNQKILANALSGKEYLIGDRFTAVDLLLAQCLYWMKNTFNQNSSEPNLIEFAKRQRKRPAYLKARDKVDIRKGDLK